MVFIVPTSPLVRVPLSTPGEHHQGNPQLMSQVRSADILGERKVFVSLDTTGKDNLKGKEKGLSKEVFLSNPSYFFSVLRKEKTETILIGLRDRCFMAIEFFSSAGPHTTLSSICAPGQPLPSRFSSSVRSQSLVDSRDVIVERSHTCVLSIRFFPLFVSINKDPIKKIFLSV